MYLYKSTTGKSINIDNFVITADPGLELKYANDVLDSFMGVNLERYTDGVLDTADNSTAVLGKGGTTTVATLPSAATVGVGFRAMVSDALTPAFLATVAGGGAVITPVFSDGTAWKVG